MEERVPTAHGWSVHSAVSVAMLCSRACGLQGWVQGRGLRDQPLRGRGLRVEGPSWESGVGGSESRVQSSEFRDQGYSGLGICSVVSRVFSLHLQSFGCSLSASGFVCGLQTDPRRQTHTHTQLFLHNMNQSHIITVVWLRSGRSDTSVGQRVGMGKEIFLRHFVVQACDESWQVLSRVLCLVFVSPDRVRDACECECECECDGLVVARNRGC